MRNPPKPPRFDGDSVREEWNRLAAVYAGAQSSGRDHYRFAFFGPAHIDLCGDVRGLDVLDVGCGAGYFSRAMANRGARVIAIDISPRMIDFAREAEQSEPLGIDYRILDAADIESALDGLTFDLATSCLALQDMPEVPRVLRGVHKVLRPGGRFVVSITHPCTDTPFRRWERDPGGAKRWLCIDRYFERAPFQFTWTQWTPEPMATTAIHAPLEDWIAWSLSTGFQLRGLREPMPTAETLKAYPDLDDATRVPYYLFLDLMA